MSITVTPTGSLGKALCNLAWLVASSATFQALVGAADAAHAMDSVYLEADDLGDAPRPRAIVFFNQYSRKQVSLQDFEVAADQYLSFEFEPSAAYVTSGNVWDQYLEFCNRIDAILAEMEALEGQGSTGYLAGEGYLAVERFDLVDGPAAVTETRAAGASEVRGYFFGVTFAVHRKGS